MDSYDQYTPDPVELSFGTESDPEVVPAAFAIAQLAQPRAVRAADRIPCSQRRISSTRELAGRGPFVTVPPGGGGSSPRSRVPLVVYPIAAGQPRRFSSVHPTEGLPGYPAIDFFAAAGTHVLAIESGRIRRFSGHDPALGPVSGPHGPFAWSLYLAADAGSDFYYTHLATRTVAVGQHVRAGQIIATVADYAKWTGTPNHTHIGVHGGHVTIEEVSHAPQVKGFG